MQILGIAVSTRIVSHLRALDLVMHCLMCVAMKPVGDVEVMQEMFQIGAKAAIDIRFPIDRMNTLE